MKEYIKPVVETTKATAEGVYAASGATGTNFVPVVGPGCNSDAMSGNYAKGTYKVPATVKEFYGCDSCPSGWSGKCDLSGGVDGDRYPDWEPLYPAGQVINSLEEKPW